MASRKPAASAPKRKPAKPVKVPVSRSWGMIGAFTAAAVVAVLIIGYTAFASWRAGRPWDDKLSALDGVTNYKKQKPAWLTQNHKEGTLKYEVTPSVGGDHNGVWQNCVGNVYDKPIPTENATHSMEHGAVWITYRPGLPADQIAALTSRVSGNDYTLMSPFQALSTNISLQAWGFRLAVDSAADARIDEFLTAARINAGPEQGASCSGGNEHTGTTPGAADGN